MPETYEANKAKEQAASAERTRLQGEVYNPIINAMEAIRQAFGAINGLPHDERAETWQAAQGHLNEAYKLLREVR